MSRREALKAGIRSLLGALYKERIRVILFVAVFILLILEITNTDVVQVSWQAVALIVVILFIIFQQDIAGIFVPNVGGVEFQRPGLAKEVDKLLRHREGELGSSKTVEEVDVEEETEIETETPDSDRDESEIDQPSRSRSVSISHLYSGKSVDEVSDDVYDIAQENPRMALLRLRSEIEGTAREFIQQRDLGPVLSDSKLVDTLAEADVLGDEVTNTYSEVRDWYNQLIHQEIINIEDALDAIDVGLDLLQYLESAGYDDKLESGSVYWKGLHLLLDMSSADPDEKFRIRKADDGIGSLVTEFRAGDSGEYLLETEKYDAGRYVVCSDTNDPIKVNGDGTYEETTELRQGTFELAEHLLTAEFDPGLVLNQGERVLTDFDIQTNRGSFVLWIGCDSLDESELERIFAHNKNFIGAFDSVDADYVAFSYKASQTLQLNFENVAAGDYTFNVISPDTHARDTATIYVQNAE